MSPRECDCPEPPCTCAPREIPYMLENTREEFERVRDLPWPPAGAEDAATRIAESRVSIAAALRERDELLAKVARVRSMRDVATDGKVTVAALDWALDG